MSFIIKDGKPYCRHATNAGTMAEVVQGNETDRSFPIIFMHGEYPLLNVGDGLWACPECNLVYHKTGLFK
jgi:hypothetical protein